MKTLGNAGLPAGSQQAEMADPKQCCAREAYHESRRLPKHSDEFPCEFRLIQAPGSGIRTLKASSVIATAKTQSLREASRYIWADQSWGRFWGWDPKENGALLIVMWNAIILHSRWGGLIRERGLAVMCVFGNIVFSLSWFGVNMLGVGLHSYGFMDRAFGALMTFIASQLVVMALGMLPQKHWRGIQARGKHARPRNPQNRY